MSRYSSIRSQHSVPAGFVRSVGTDFEVVLARVVDDLGRRIEPTDCTLRSDAQATFGRWYP